MSLEEKFEKLITKKEIEYFKKYFDGKCLYDAINEIFEIEFHKLVQAYVRFGMLKDILTVIKDVEEPKGQLLDILDTYITGVGMISDGLREIIEPIAEAMS